MKVNNIIVIAFAILLASCSVSKNCKAPKLNLPSHIVNGLEDSVSIADAKWWEFYGDSTLCNIITKTLENNKDMLIAIEKMEKLQHLYKADKFNFLPSITGKGLVDAETKNYGGENFKRSDEYSAKGSLSWELDFFGSLRSAKQKNLAEFLASVEQKRATQMLLVANVASEYYKLLALDNELNIVKRTLMTRSDGVHQAKLRFEGGLTSETIYQQAKVEYASAAALIPELEKKIRISESTIALLMGEYPNWRIKRDIIKLDLSFPDSLSVGIPSTLLQKRPDVMAADQQLKSAMAAAGIAYADCFPKIIFNLGGGWENGELKDLLKSPFSYIAGNLLSPIIGYGNKRAKYKASISAYNEARLAYEKKVLEVFKEVDDAIITYKQAQQTKELKANLSEAAYKYVELAGLQYSSGSINYIEVLDAQRKYFDSQIGLSNAIRDQYLALVQLYKALGGGWEK